MKTVKDADKIPLMKKMTRYVAVAKLGRKNPTEGIRDNAMALSKPHGDDLP